MCHVLLAWSCVCFCFNSVPFSHLKSFECEINTQIGLSEQTLRSIPLYTANYKYLLPLPPGWNYHFTSPIHVHSVFHTDHFERKIRPTWLFFFTKLTVVRFAEVIDFISCFLFSQRKFPWVQIFKNKRTKKPGLLYLIYFLKKSIHGRL